MKNLRFWTAVLLLAGAALLLHTRSSTDRNPLASHWRCCRAISMDGGNQPGNRSGDARCSWAGDFLSRVYSLNAQTAPIGLFIGYFPTQRTGQSIHSPKHCLPGAGWVFESSDYVTLTDVNGKPHHVGEYIISNGAAGSL